MGGDPRPLLIAFLPCAVPPPCLSASCSSTPWPFCARAGDWPQWAGSDAKNMVSSEKGLPESFVPGQRSRTAPLNLATARNVPVGGKGRERHLLHTFDRRREGFHGCHGAGERSHGVPRCGYGKLLWKWEGAP